MEYSGASEKIWLVNPENYDKDTLIDRYSGMPYSFQMIVESMKPILERGNG